MDFLKHSKLFATLTLLSLVGITILIFSQITFIFRPLEAVFSSVFLPILISVFILYIFLPIFKQLEKITKRKNLSIILIMCLIFLSVYIIIQVIVPIVIVEISKFIAQVPSMVNAAVHYLDGSILEDVVSPFVESLDLQQVGSVVVRVFSGATTSLTNIIYLVSHSAIVIFTVPLLLIYMFKDGDKVPEKLALITPEKYKQLVKSWCDDFHNSASTYISGKMLVCSYVGISSYFVFTILGLPNALLLALICGLMDIIPYFGPFIGAAPAFLYSLSDDLNTSLLLVLLITIIQFGESYLVSPIVMNKVIHIHPIVAVFLLLIAGNLLGFLGMIIALPAYTIVRGMIQTFIRFKQTEKDQIEDIEEV